MIYAINASYRYRYAIGGERPAIVEHDDALYIVATTPTVPRAYLVDTALEHALVAAREAHDEGDGVAGVMAALWTHAEPVVDDGLAAFVHHALGLALCDRDGTPAIADAHVRVTYDIVTRDGPRGPWATLTDTEGRFYGHDEAQLVIAALREGGHGVQYAIRTAWQVVDDAGAPHGEPHADRTAALVALDTLRGGAR